MMDTTNHDEDRDPVRKVLRSLPKVEAPDDFELRLKERVTAQAESALEVLFSPRRIPAYALSILAVVTVSTIAYFSFIRTGTSPNVPAQNQAEPQEEKALISPQQPPSSSAASQKVLEGQPSRSSPAEQPSPEKRVGLPTVPQESVREDVGRRGLMREVGGTGFRSQQSESLGAPFLHALPDPAVTRWSDSVARADSARHDSLRRLLENQRRRAR